MTAASSSSSRFKSFSVLPVTLLMQAAASAAIIAPAVAAPRLTAMLNVSGVAIGIYVALVYSAATLSSQWGAVLVRRWGPIRTSQAALLLCAAGLPLMAVPHLAAATAGAVLLGLGYGPMTPASSEMLARSTPPERIALVFSIKQTGVPLGSGLAGLLVPSALLAWGATAAMALIALLCLLGIALGQPLRRELDALRDARSPLPKLANITAPMRAVLKHPVLRRLSMAAMMFSAVQASLNSYLVSFLTADLAWTLVAAGGALSVAQGASIVGRIAWGAAADRLRDGPRRTLRWLTILMGLAGVVLAGFAASTGAWLVLAVLAIYGGTAIGWHGVVLGTVARVVAHDEAASATAGCLFFAFFGSLIAPPLFGLAGALFGSLGLAFALLAVPLLWVLYVVDRRWPE